MSRFLAHLSRLKFITRWGLKRNTSVENVVEHSWEVAVIAHLLATIRNTQFGDSLNANAIAAAALFHDASEVLTGDMPSPVKYHSPEITRAYKAIEHQAQVELWQLLPETMRPAYRALLLDEAMPAEYHAIIKTADTISALLKCRHEIRAGNREFETAQQDISRKVEALSAEQPEVRYFLDHFEPAFGMTLDELLSSKS